MTFLTACNLPTAVPTVTPTPTAPATQTPTPTDVPTPKPDLGDPANPILLALPPSQFLDPVAVANGQTLATLIEEQTGLRVVAVAPTTYSELIESLKIGNAHIAVLPPFAMVQAYQQNAVQAAFASTQEEVASYGAQFVARSDRFTAYYDPSDRKKYRRRAAGARPSSAGKKPAGRNQPPRPAISYRRASWAGTKSPHRKARSCKASSRSCAPSASARFAISAARTSTPAPIPR